MAKWPSGTLEPPKAKLDEMERILGHDLSISIATLMNDTALVYVIIIISIIIIIRAAAAAAAATTIRLSTWMV